MITYESVVRKIEEQNIGEVEV